MQFLENAKREKSKHLEEQTPIFNDLEEHFEKRTQDFEKMKKDVVGMWCKYISTLSFSIKYFQQFTKLTLMWSSVHNKLFL